ncbi:nucleotide pyrophosphohydrolase [Gammaproteobacteria bacterium]|nr:nucleotide pyrophosphohydrolase [Gammaproteobacteria bacterium]
MSALLEMFKEGEKAREFGFSYSDYRGFMRDVIDECKEVEEAIENKESIERIHEEVGDLLFAAVSLAECLGCDIESTIERSTNKFAKRMDHVIMLTQEQGLSDLKGQDVSFMMSLWRQAKKAVG